MVELNMNCWVVFEFLLREIFKLIWFQRILVVFSWWHHASINEGIQIAIFYSWGPLRNSVWKILDGRFKKFWRRSSNTVKKSECTDTAWYYFHSRNCDNSICNGSILCGCETKPESKFFCEWSTWFGRLNIIGFIHMQSPEKSFEPLPYKKYDTMKLEYHFERLKNWLNFISQ